MKFGIIIPTYNRARVLPRAIRSVVKQDYGDWTLYVVDDGSVDETEAAVKPFLSDSRILYLRSHVNLGRLHCLNLALDRIEAEGIDWFTWMDDDDQLTVDCLSVARGEVERHPGFGMILFSAVGADGKDLSLMRVSGPADYLQEKFLRKKIGRETHEFVAVRYLNGIRLNAPSSGAQGFWFGELSLRTGAVFCKQTTKIKEYLDDGITLQRRGQSGRARDERKIRLETYVLRHWVSVIRRHPSSLSAYLVWAKLLRRLVVRILRRPFRTDRSTLR